MLEFVVRPGPLQKTGRRGEGAPCRPRRRIQHKLNLFKASLHIGHVPLQDTQLLLIDNCRDQNRDYDRITSYSNVSQTKLRDTSYEQSQPGGEQQTNHDTTTTRNNQHNKRTNEKRKQQTKTQQTEGASERRRGQGGEGREGVILRPAKT